MWEKRKSIELQCPSGFTVQVRRPSPEIGLKSGRMAAIFRRQPDIEGDVDKQLDYIGNLPDAELDKLMGFARILIADVVAEPQLYLKPQGDQLSPDDVPLPDFWFIFTWAMNGGPTMPVATKEGEMDVESVSNFPSGQDAGDSVSEDSAVVQ